MSLAPYLYPSELPAKLEKLQEMLLQRGHTRETSFLQAEFYPSNFPAVVITIIVNPNQSWLSLCTLFEQTKHLDMAVEQWKDIILDFQDMDYPARETNESDLWGVHSRIAYADVSELFNNLAVDSSDVLDLIYPGIEENDMVSQGNVISLKGKAYSFNSNTGSMAKLTKVTPISKPEARSIEHMTFEKHRHYNYFTTMVEVARRQFKDGRSTACLRVVDWHLR